MPEPDYRPTPIPPGPPPIGPGDPRSGPPPTTTAVSTSTAVKVVTHSTIAVFAVAALSVLQEDLRDGEFPHTRVEWYHLLILAAIQGAIAVGALLKKSPLTKENS